MILPVAQFLSVGVLQTGPRFINYNFSHVHQITCVNLLHAKGNIVDDIWNKSLYELPKWNENEEMIVTVNAIYVIA